MLVDVKKEKKKLKDKKIIKRENNSYLYRFWEVIFFKVKLMIIKKIFVFKNKLESFIFFYKYFRKNVLKSILEEILRIVIGLRFIGNIRNLKEGMLKLKIIVILVFMIFMIFFIYRILIIY